MTEASERRGRSLERKPLRISSNDDSEISSSSKNTNSTPPLEAASAAAHTPSAPRSFAISDSSPSPSASPSRLSLWEKKAMDDLSEDFTSSLYQVSRQREFSNSLALQLDANVEARLRYLHHTADHDRGPKGLTADERHIEDSPMSTETPSLSSNGSESPLGSEEDLSSLHHHLPNFYADATPTGSTTTLTLLDDLSAASTPTAEDTPWQLSPPRAGSTTTTSSSQDSSSSEHGEAEGEDDNDSRMLSFPLKVCAYALALLPIPTSLLSTAAGSLGGASGRLPSSRAQSPPPLPVEFSHSPKTCKLGLSLTAPNALQSKLTGVHLPLQIVPDIALPAALYLLRLCPQARATPCTTCLRSVQLPALPFQAASPGADPSGESALTES